MTTAALVIGAVILAIGAVIVIVAAILGWFGAQHDPDDLRD